jgi:hypothetical protein
MGRTESKTFQCHPNAAQGQIDLHQKFHWSLLSSQDVKTVDNSLETLGDTTYSVRSSEHFVKLTFSRDLDAPNLNEIKKLEAAYFGLREPIRRENPKKPESYLANALCCMIVPISLVVGFATSFVIGLTVCIIAFVLCVALSLFLNAPKEAQHKEECARIDQEHKQNWQKYSEERQRILSEVAKYN